MSNVEVLLIVAVVLFGLATALHLLRGALEAALVPAGLGFMALALLVAQ